MKKALFTFLFLSMFISCYDLDDSITTNREVEFNRIKQESKIIADGISNYFFVLKLPGVKFGDSKKVSLTSTWGTWLNNSRTAEFDIAYNKNIDMYVDTVQLKANRYSGSFTIKVTEENKHLKTLNFNANPQYPSFVQIVSDSVNLKLSPNNSTKLKILFFNEEGFPSYKTKFILRTDANINIYPREVFIDTLEASATLQLSNETKIGNINIYGEINVSGIQQPKIDTLKININ